MIVSRIAIVLACAALAGCLTTGAKPDGTTDKRAAPAADSGPGLFESKSGYALKTGLGLYSDGKFDAAAKELQNALDLGLGDADRIKAHKHLAFIHCISGRKPKCRDEFMKALDINPNLELDPAEAGHPIWGPVFKAAKASKAKTEASTDAKDTKDAKDSKDAKSAKDAKDAKSRKGTKAAKAKSTPQNDSSTGK